MGLSNMHKVTVIIPLYNLAHLVSEAIDSVLSQTYKDIEIIVVDDGSKDNAKEVLASYIKQGKIRYIYQENRGLSAARNTGLKAAQGKYIKFLDSDDSLYPEQIERQINDIKDENGVFSVTDYHDLRPNGELIRKRVYVGRREWQLGIFIETNRAVPHAFLTPKSLIVKVGGFDETLTSCEDWDLWLRLLKNGVNVKYNPYVGCCYRILMSSMSANMERMYLQECRVMEKVSHWFLDPRTITPFLKDSILKKYTLLIEEGIARHKDLDAILPNTLKVTDNLFKLRKKGIIKKLYLFLGIKKFTHLRYFIKNIKNPEYEYKLINITNIDRYGNLFREPKIISPIIRFLNIIITLNIMTVYKNIISIIKLFPAYIADIYLQSKPIQENDKNIFITFDDETLFRYDDGLGREAFYILKTFSDGGYHVYFYRSKSFISYWKLGLLGRLIYKIKNLRLVSRLPNNTQNFVYGFDAIRPVFLKYPWKNLLYINIKRPTSCYLGNVIPMQFYMMPMIYACGLEENLDQYRQLVRKYRIFFGGSLNPIYYDSPVFKKKYPHLMTRLEGFQTIRNSDIDVLLINKRDELDKFSENSTYLNRLVIVEVKTSFPIKPEQWLQFVGQSDFFMCFSGTDYPICHNSIEAMAVGTIPIIAYGDWFDPQLEHGKNAIIYSDQDDLIQKIKIVMKMSLKDIQELRRGVIEYYDNFLAKGYMARQYEQQVQSISTLMLFPKIISDPKNEEEGQNFIRKFQQLNIQQEVLK